MGKRRIVSCSSRLLCHALLTSLPWASLVLDLKGPFSATRPDRREDNRPAVLRVASASRIRVNATLDMGLQRSATDGCRTVSTSHVHRQNISKNYFDVRDVTSSRRQISGFIIFTSPVNTTVAVVAVSSFRSFWFLMVVSVVRDTRILRSTANFMTRH